MKTMKLYQLNLINGTKLLVDITESSTNCWHYIYYYIGKIQKWNMIMNENVIQIMLCLNDTISTVIEINTFEENLTNNQ